MQTKSVMRGFTLVELIVAMCVLAIMATLAIPMFASMVATNRTRTAAYSLVSALTLARSEAIKRNATVSVLPFLAGWQAGWEVDAAGTTLKEIEVAPELTISGPAGGVGYLPTGRLTTPAIVLFTVSASTGYTRCVVIDLGGRATLNPGEHNDGSCT